MPVSQSHKDYLSIQALTPAAKSWRDAEAFLTETHQLKEFALWCARRDGFTEEALEKLEKALDKIDYGAPPAAEPIPSTVNPSAKKENTV